jgi:hypothetical protein
MAQQSKTGRPGAMTQAMQAATVSAGPKVLRIGVMQGTRMSEERIIRDRATVSVGTTERTPSPWRRRSSRGASSSSRWSGGSTAQLHRPDGGALALAEGIKKLADLRSRPAPSATPGAFRCARGDLARQDPAGRRDLPVPVRGPAAAAAEAAAPRGHSRGLGQEHRLDLQRLLLVLPRAGHREHRVRRVHLRPHRRRRARPRRLAPRPPPRAPPAVAEEQQEPDAAARPESADSSRSAPRPRRSSSSSTTTPRPPRRTRPPGRRARREAGQRRRRRRERAALRPSTSSARSFRPSPAPSTPARAAPATTSRRAAS